MTSSVELLTLAKYLAGEFENREQAKAEPAWYVDLRLWLRPVHLFTEDSLALFAEQANVIYMDKPYRPRILRLRQRESSPAGLVVEYYMLKQPDQVRGAGSQPELLRQLTPEQLEFLPGCTLNVSVREDAPGTYHFCASAEADACCRFTYQGSMFQVSLGFESRPEQFLSYDKGIDPQTGKAIWGALLGPYVFTKRQDFSDEFLT